MVVAPRLTINEDGPWLTVAAWCPVCDEKVSEHTFNAESDTGDDGEAYGETHGMEWIYHLQCRHNGARLTLDGE